MYIYKRQQAKHFASGFWFADKVKVLQFFTFFKKENSCFHVKMQFLEYYVCVSQSERRGEGELNGFFL